MVSLKDIHNVGIAFKKISLEDRNLRKEILKTTDRFIDIFVSGEKEDFERIVVQARLFKRERKPSFLEDSDSQMWISIQDGLIDWGEGLYRPDLWSYMNPNVKILEICSRMDDFYQILVGDIAVANLNIDEDPIYFGGDVMDSDIHHPPFEAIFIIDEILCLPLEAIEVRMKKR